MHTYADEGGRKLKEIMTKYNLKAVSTCFQPAKGRAPYTYINKQPHLAPSQIDYIIASKR